MSALDRPEQVLVREDGDDLELALVLDDGLLDSGPATLDEYCSCAEGVSHLLYLALAAERESQVSQLELEVQSEIDKFALLLFWSAEQASVLITRLFLSFSLRDSVECTLERRRYLEANRLALGFCRYLNTHFVSQKRTEPLLDVLRKVYRMGGARKLEYVSGCRP